MKSKTSFDVVVFGGKDISFSRMF